jgi:type IV pilus assembly protein PilC
MKFKYKAQKSDGEIVEGERVAQDKFVLFDDLKKEGLSMLFAKDVGAKKSFFAWQKLLSRFSNGSVPIHQKIIFAKNLGAMIDAGLPLSRALSVMERQIDNKNLKIVTNSLNEEIKKGTTLSMSLAKFPSIFSSLFVSIVRAGEEGGNLSSGLRIITAQLERMFFLRRKIRGALMYPAVIVVLIIVVGILMFALVIPKLTASFADFNVTLPLSTRIIIGASDFLKNHTFVFISGIFVVCVAVWMFLQTPRGKRVFDYLSINLPILGVMIRETNTARAARTVSSLLSSGVNVTEALQITGDVVQNSYFKDVLLEAKEAIQKGTSLSSAFSENQKIYPAFFAEMVAAGEETGNLSAMLGDVASFYENEVDEKTKDFSTVIEPIIMIFIGSAVGFFALAMLSPMYSMMGSIQ